MKITVTKAERIVIVAALKAYRLEPGSPIDQLADRIGRIDSADDGPEIELIARGLRPSAGHVPQDLE